MIGTGLTATGARGGVALRDLSNGADIVAGGAANSSTTLILGNGEIGSDIASTGKLPATGKNAGDGQWTAASFGNVLGAAPHRSRFWQYQHREISRGLTHPRG